MILPPLFWFYISWKATGDWLACFRQRQQYLDWLLVMNPAIAHFSCNQHPARRGDLADLV
jgi:hypothetical protein